MLFCKPDNLYCAAWRYRLASLVMTNVPLRAADTLSKGLLCDAQPQPDFSKWIHAEIIAALLRYVNSAASGALEQRH